MLLAIDVGNTHIVTGLFFGDGAPTCWRFPTELTMTEDQFAAMFFTLQEQASIGQKPSRVVVASVSPSVNHMIERFSQKWLSCEPRFLTSQSLPQMKISYEPSAAVGADRIANALAAKKFYTLPALVVDFGTATTFDAIGSGGEYLGGSILPGVEVSLEALVSHTAKLPRIELVPPKTAIGTTTVQSLQSGVVLGYAGAIDALTRAMREELGGKATVVATGGIAPLFGPLCKEIQEVNPHLTLEGLRIFAEL